MRTAGHRKRSAQIAAISALLLVIACQPGSAPVSRQGNFKANYMIARTALEGGQYDRAARGYAGLVGQSGPLTSRIRLEFAHSLLRAGKFQSAAAEAGQVARAETGVTRSAALAVQATADHEFARAEMAKGRRDVVIGAQLMSAKKALDEMLAQHKELDPLGAMVARRDAITAELSLLQ